MIETNSRSYLHISSDIPYQGQNFTEVHSKFIPTQDITFEDVFDWQGTRIRGSWSADGGDLAAPEDTRERRYLCISGKASFKFTGSSVALRVSLNPGWGQAHVLIDGRSPSTIPGVSFSRDIVSSNADTANSWGNESRDLLLADNLPNGEHTVELFCVDNNSKAFFVTSGAKTYDWKKKDLGADKFVIDQEEKAQPLKLTVRSTSTDAAIGTKLEFDPFFLDPTTRLPIGAVTLPIVSDGNPQSVSVVPALTGKEPTSTISKPVKISYKKRDDVGGTEWITVEEAVPYTHEDVKISDAWWVDPAGTTAPLEVVVTTSKNSPMTIKVKGTRFGMRLWMDYGLGSANVMLNAVEKLRVVPVAGTNTITVANPSGISVGMWVQSARFANGTTVTGINGTTITLSGNATGAGKQTIWFGNYIGEFVCHAPSEADEKTFKDFYISSLGATFDGTVYIFNRDASSSFCWNSVLLSTRNLYSYIEEEFHVDFKLTQVLPASVKNVRLENGVVTFETPNGQDYNFNLKEPYDNRHADTVKVEYRFPSFICCYTPGYVELFKEYDIVITDPGALTRKETKELQDLGIQVYMYVSFGEEDSVRKNIWDMNSEQVPHPGDGLGPGGYASYYMKGGMGYREFSECGNDRQALEGVKACAVNQPQYFTGTGRCGSPCEKDWRTGYEAWRDGGKCGGGFSSANNWQRDASTACTNSSCRSYKPVHQKCPKFTPAENAWGQDYSVATPDFPDENGIWASYYVEATRRDKDSWFGRLRDYYLPLIFQEPTPQEDFPINTKRLLDDGTPVFGVQTTVGALDEGEAFSLTDTVSGFEYLPNLHYSMDKMDGTFIFANLDYPPSPDYVAPFEGQQLRLRYFKRGLGADGVFMDTVDTVDVYPAEEYQAGFSGIINELKMLYPLKGFCSNRGFSILDRIIDSCSLVMTESVFSEYDFNEGVYNEVTGAAADWNAEVAKNIQDLRRSKVFDVVCLNYAPNGPEGDTIRANVERKCLELGWMPWLSTILLNDPLPNRPYRFEKGYIRTNELRKIRAVNL